MSKSLSDTHQQTLDNGGHADNAPRKYELAEARDFHGRSVHQIRALRDIPMYGVKAGDLGGYVQGYHNLSQDGEAWIKGNSVVAGNAVVQDNALVAGGSFLHGTSLVSGSSRVYNVEDAWGANITNGAVVMNEFQPGWHDGSDQYPIDEARLPDELRIHEIKREPGPNEPSYRPPVTPGSL